MQRFVAHLYRIPAILILAYLAKEANLGILGGIMVVFTVLMLLRLSFYVEYKDKF